MAPNRAPQPRHHYSRRTRRAPQTWPLNAHPDRVVWTLLIALGYGAGAALIVFGLFLAVAA